MQNIRPYRNIIPQIDATTYIDPAAVIIGDVCIGANSSVWPMAVVRGDVHHIRIGTQTNIQDGAVLHVAADTEFNPSGNALIIGNNVTVGHKAVLHACKIDDHVLIGMGAIVLDGAHIPEYVIIAAGSIVPPNKKLESGYLYLGSPAKPTRALTEKERAFLAFSAEHYVRIKNSYQEPANLEHSVANQT